MDALIEIRVTPGEALDRLSILGVKRERLAGTEKGRMASRQYEELVARCEHLFPMGNEAYSSLLRVNGQLWDAEDDVRRTLGEFGTLGAFAEAAASVPRLNDERSRLKIAFDEAVGCAHTEVKGYV